MSKSRDLANIISGGFTADDIPNLDASKITTGTFANARLSEGSVTQHVTAFDDNKIVNDLSTLALRQASDQNKSAYNTNSQSVDVFQDDTGIDTTNNVTRNASEYISSVINTNSFTATKTGDVTLDTSTKQFGSGSVSFGGVLDTTGDYILYNTSNTGLLFGSGDFTLECWIKINTGASGRGRIAIASRRERNQGSAGWFWNLNNGTNQFGYMDSNVGWLDGGGTGADLNGTSNLRDGNWHHVAIVRESNVFSNYVDGTRESTTSAYTGTIVEDGSAYDFAIGDNASNLEGSLGGNPSSTTTWGNIDEMRISNIARYSGSSYTVPTSEFATDANTLFLNHFNENTFTDISSLTVNATGNFTGTTITAPSSVSEMGAIITYQDNAGTNALNTDIVLQLSADGGSNYSTATLTALPDFSTGIKMAKVNDLAVTAGTQLKYKINFANQTSGSKEARIRGVALQY